MLFPRHTLDRILDCFWPLSLTAHRCFQLAYGLLHRLRAYYSPPPMLIFLLSESSQAICWHATHFMVEVLGGLGSIVDDTSPTFSILDSNMSRYVLGCHKTRSKLVGRWWDWGVVGRVCNHACYRLGVYICDGMGWCIEGRDVGLLELMSALSIDL
jgi:hypothetical protein